MDSAVEAQWPPIWNVIPCIRAKIGVKPGKKRFISLERAGLLPARSITGAGRGRAVRRLSDAKNIASRDNAD
jgi:hypothetical protein